MLATAARELPQGRDWGFEPKWDGFRCLACLGHETQLRSRRGRDLTSAVPELRGLYRCVPLPVVLDGELVAVREGRPSLDALRRRVLGGRSEPRTHVVLVAFDLLVLGNRSVMALPYDRRRRILEALGIEGPGIGLTPWFGAEEGPILLSATRDLGWEGVVAKRLSSPYRPGVRSRDWVKVKHVRRERMRHEGSSLQGLHEPGLPPVRSSHRRRTTSQ
jgi:bifunctional non-homologous end joining protein LigD